MEKNKKDTILKEAASIIAYEGLDNFSLSILASRVGISKATLYNYFKSKDELLSELISTGHRRFMKSGFNLTLNGTTEDILVSLLSHWNEIFISEENTTWLRIVFSTHLTNKLTQEEYRTISLMLKSQAQVVMSRFNLQQSIEAVMTELFSSLLLKRVEESLEETETDPSVEAGKIALLIDTLIKK